ncbi:MAG: 50S ribosomal protein L11 methyltransferase [Acidobacteriia bacterium]|nr:50S ribosomal protein L11 methyltransferase [Terriglobia bacterium]
MYTYSLSGYGVMAADRIRNEAYAQALRSAIQPGCVVLDIGTGTGAMAVLACQLGAGRVFAIEPSPVIQVARQVAAANHCAERIEFIEDLSTRATLPVQAHVIVSDLRGILPLFQQHIPSIVDARRRHLAPGGTLIPRKDFLWAAIVEAPKTYSEIVDPWEKNTFGQDLSAARQIAVNKYCKARMPPEQLLAKPSLWKTLDYRQIENPDAEGGLEWTIERDGTGHGILMWFDAELTEGVGYSNAPGTPKVIYGSLFFPWPQPVALAAGQNVAIELHAKLLEQDYTWRWKTRIAPAGKSAETRFSFDQSDLQGMLLSPVSLRKTAADYVPSLSEDGALHARTLALMDGRRSLEEIARQLCAEFPGRFPGWRQALGYAGALSQKLSR